MNKYCKNVLCRALLKKDEVPVRYCKCCRKMVLRGETTATVVVISVFTIGKIIIELLK